MKKLLNLNGVKILRKEQLLAINGGAGKCSDSCNPPSSGPWPCYHNNSCLCPGWCVSQGCVPV